MDLLSPDDPSLVEEVSWVPCSPLPQQPVQVCGVTEKNLWGLLFWFSRLFFVFLDKPERDSSVWSVRR